MRNRVRELRKAKDWTIHDLHLATGLAHGFLSEIETGKKIPSVVNAQKIANALGCKVEDVFPLSEASAVPVTA